MKLFSFIAIVFYMLFLLPESLADTPVIDTEILARRGAGVVTQEMFAARADMIPDEARYEALRNVTRFHELLNTMVLRAQLAADARAAGFDNDPMIKSRMELAAETELSDAWLQHYMENQPDADYEQLAQEYYLLHQEEFMEAEKYSVSHILISTEQHPQEEAKELAADLHRQLELSPDSFDQFVLEYSEDSSAASNKGKFGNVKRGDMVKPFEDAAFALKEGEISRPVLSAYGYHLIRLDALIAPQQKDFEQMKPHLVEAEHKRHQERLRDEYLSSLSMQEMDVSEESMREMIRRVFGEGYLDTQTDSGN